MNEINPKLESNMNKEPASSQPYHYAFRIKGHLDPHWDRLEGLTAIHNDLGETLFSGPIVDQASLHGLLARIRDLNLTLLSIDLIDSNKLGREGSNGKHEN